MQPPIKANSLCCVAQVKMSIAVYIRNFVRSFIPLLGGDSRLTSEYL